MEKKTWKHSYNKNQVKKESLIYLAELIGTFLLVAGILAPSSFGFGLPNADASGNILHAIDSEVLWSTINWIFAFIFMKALWVAGLIFVLVVMFRRWSANFNPVVTLAEITAGNNSHRVGFTKIAVQIIGGFSATYFMALVIIPWMSGMSIEDALLIGNYSLDATQPIFTHFNYESFSFNPGDMYVTETLTATNNWWYWILQIMFETVITFALIMSVFIGGDKYSENQRLFIITGTVWAILLVGIRFNTIALNPIRLFAPAFVTMQFGNSIPLEFVWIFLFGEIFAFQLFSLLTSKQNQKADMYSEYNQGLYLEELLINQEKRNH